MKRIFQFAPLREGRLVAGITSDSISEISIRAPA